MYHDHVVIDSLTCVGEENEFKLPYSGVRGSISNRYWQDSDPWDERQWITPDLPVELTLDAYVEGHDPALERILELLRNQDDK